MKRRQFIHELEQFGCRFQRHGGCHDIDPNPANGKKAPIPRHQEIKKYLCRIIRQQLGVPPFSDSSS